MGLTAGSELTAKWLPMNDFINGPSFLPQVLPSRSITSWELPQLHSTSFPVSLQVWLQPPFIPNSVALHLSTTASIHNSDELAGDHKSAESILYMQWLPVRARYNFRWNPYNINKTGGNKLSSCSFLISIVTLCHCATQSDLTDSVATPETQEILNLTYIYRCDH